MAEEPDDEEGREPSDSSVSGSDEERESETGSEPHEDTTDEEQSPDEGTTSGSPTDDDAASDDAADADADGTNDADGDGGDGGGADSNDTVEPAFTDVKGLGPDTDGLDDDADDADERSGDADDADDDGYMFEDYDPDEPPAAAAEHGARPPADDGDDAPTDVDRSPDSDEGDDGLLGGGPESDQEMPLAAHIEEMMKRLSVVFIVGGAVALTLLGLGQAFEQVPTAVDIIDALWNNAIPGAPQIEGRRPRVYGPLELILTKLKVTALAGLLVALPVFVYETYMFMRPGLFPKERRYYLAAIPTSLVLGTVGMAFSHFVIIPAIMRYFTVYTDENVATVAYGLESTFSLIIVLMGYMAVIFQIPLFIMLAIMMGIVTRQWLEDKRLLFWGGFLTIAFLVNPDPTGMTPFIIAATMIVLYEGTLALLRWTGN
ncbi:MULTISPECIES: twin-arginine translocase subunit TatC [Halolamina]|uniref:Sec-independent protein translocase protein TatC n=1 Tax=Halolamina pelagica TaxID=699431 RepID=A0A1I5RM21_9EURY|nr:MULTISPECIES: twin-arginine translocase subunit TatC [Halolamina]NHX35250.1 MFS transporter [Halolamina sp. R1-12]SFP59450.1 sec-independent protein translocase protein TatC [Halolamina pelagica]